MLTLRRRTRVAPVSQVVQAPRTDDPRRKAKKPEELYGTCRNEKDWKRGEGV